MEETLVREMLRKSGMKGAEIEEKITILRQDAEVPVKLIGIGQTGVGKTALNWALGNALAQGEDFLGHQTTKGRPGFN